MESTSCISEDMRTIPSSKGSGAAPGTFLNRREAVGSRAETGYFSPSNIPEGYCDRHIPVAYDTIDGGVVLEGMCPSENISYIGMLSVVRGFPIQIYVTDAQYVWRGIEGDVLPETSPKLPFFNSILGEKEYCGITNTEYQFNRLCRAHFDYYEWLEKNRRCLKKLRQRVFY